MGERTRERRKNSGQIQASGVNGDRKMPMQGLRETEQLHDSGKNKVGGRRKKLHVAIVLGMLLLVALTTWRSLLTEVESRARYIPDYEPVDIEMVLEKTKHSDLSQEEYKLLYEQTGMSPTGVDALIAEERQEALLELQENLFTVIPVVCTPNTIITREERTQSKALIPYIEEGDILVTFNCHAYVWRNGHAALVADAEKELLVESGQLGTESKVVHLRHWENYPAFAVLRLKGADRGERAAIGEYAQEELVGITYRLEALKSGLEWGTHCAHLTWYAYKNFGCDIDADGGFIVTPRDIFESDQLEIVQIYGMPMPAFEEIYEKY